MRRVACLLTVVLATIFCRAPVAAHPLGNFTINHLAKVSVDKRGVTIRYIVDIAEIPTFQIMAERSIEGPQRSLRLAEWAEDERKIVAAGLTVDADGRRLTLASRNVTESTRPGAGGLPTLYFVTSLHTTFPRGSPRLVDIADNNYSDRVGWKDIVVAPQTEPTRELRAYPNALLGSPRSVTTASIALGHDSRVAHETIAATKVLEPAGSTSQVRSNLLADMLAKGSSNLAVVLLTFVIAIGLGALHALEPGHGKTLLAVSLVGAHATPKQAVMLALALTLAHTAGVLALGLALLALAQFLVPESVYPWITLVSGVLVALLGASALARHVRQCRGLTHEHHHLRSHHHGHSHATDKPGVRDRLQAQISFRNIVVMAVSGNVAPCPAALVVLLTALALHQLAYGFLVVVAFSIGLGSVLTALGIVVVRGASWLSTRRGFSKIAVHSPLVTAAVIALIGVVMIARAAMSIVAVSAWAVAALIMIAIAGYAFAPGHSHATQLREAP